MDDSQLQAVELDWKSPTIAPMASLRFIFWSFLFGALGEDLAEWSTASWYVQVDGVMGGLSSGNLQMTDTGPEFQGVINMNGGGFSSFRRSFSGKDLSGYSGIWVETEVVTNTPSRVPLGMHIQFGDSSRYNFGAAFAIPAGAVGETFSVYLPFSWFTKQLLWRCQSCVLNTQSIWDLGVYVLYQEGPFKLKIRQIRAVQAPAAQSTVPSLDITDVQAGELVAEAISRGSTLWNKGNQEICGAVYMMTAKMLLEAKNVDSKVKALSRAALTAGDQYPVNLGTNAAWILRKAFDHIIAGYNGQSPPSDSNYPVVAHGNWALNAMEGKIIEPVFTTTPFVASNSAAAHASWIFLGLLGHLWLATQTL